MFSKAGELQNLLQTSSSSRTNQVTYRSLSQKFTGMDKVEDQMEARGNKKMSLRTETVLKKNLLTERNLEFRYTHLP